jgi:hypothetical protein
VIQNWYGVVAEYKESEASGEKGNAYDSTYQPQVVCFEKSILKSQIVTELFASAAWRDGDDPK